MNTFDPDGRKAQDARRERHYQGFCAVVMLIALAMLIWF